MKSINCLILLLTLGCFTSFGQVNKGTLLLGGTISYKKNDVADEDLISRPRNAVNLKTFTIGPRTGLFIANNLAIGFMINYYHNHYRLWDNETQSFSGGQTQILAAGPFARYYHFVVPELALFAQASATYGHDYNLKNYSEIFTNLAPGLTYFITSKVALEMIIGGIGYNHSVYKPSDDYRLTSSLVDLRFINGAQIGVSFYLKR